MTTSTAPPIPAAIHHHLSSPPAILFTCGLPASGKSTLTATLLTTYPTLHRLSIDSWIFTHHGLYGIDYPPSLLPTLQDSANAALKNEFIELLKKGENVIVDFAFPFKEDREEWRGMVEEYGWNGEDGRAKTRILMVLFDGRGREEVLMRRIKERRENGRNANNAVEITEEVLRGYSEGFEWPTREEGEMVVIRVGEEQDSG